MYVCMYVRVYVCMCVCMYVCVCVSIVHIIADLVIIFQVYRVYYDRLVDVGDQSWLFELMQKMVKLHFKDDFQGIFNHLAVSGGKVNYDDMRSLLFGDYMKPDAVSVGGGASELCCLHFL